MVRSTCHRGWIFIVTMITMDQHNQGLRHYNFQILEHSFNFEDILFGQIHGEFSPPSQVPYLLLV